jgi:hypothetical protein
MKKKNIKYLLDLKNEKNSYFFNDIIIWLTQNLFQPISSAVALRMNYFLLLSFSATDINFFFERRIIPNADYK